MYSSYLPSIRLTFNQKCGKHSIRLQPAVSPRLPFTPNDEAVKRESNSCSSINSLGEKKRMCCRAMCVLLWPIPQSRQSRLSGRPGSGNARTQVMLPHQLSIPPHHRRMQAHHWPHKRTKLGAHLRSSSNFLRDKSRIF